MKRVLKSWGFWACAAGMVIALLISSAGSIMNISQYLSTQSEDPRLVTDIRNALLCSAKDAFSQYNIYIPMMQHQDTVIFLVPNNSRVKAHLSTILQRAESELCLKFPALKLQAGIGCSYKSPIDFRKSYQEAKQALVAARVQSADTPLTSYEDLGLYSLLLNINDSHILEDFYQKTFGALIDYDKSNHAELYLTLTTYFANNTDLQNTAAALYIHKNTLKYRLEKIRDILGCDIRDTGAFLKLGIGIEIGKILSANT
jgi:sugar diacid utilization regulator